MTVSTIVAFAVMTAPAATPEAPAAPPETFTVTYALDCTGTNVPYINDTQECNCVWSSKSWQVDIDNVPSGVTFTGDCDMMAEMCEYDPAGLRTVSSTITIPAMKCFNYRILTIQYTNSIDIPCDDDDDCSNISYSVCDERWSAPYFIDCVGGGGDPG